MNIEKTIQFMAIGGLSLYQGSSVYEESRHRGHSGAYSLLRAIGDVAAWNLFPGMMASTMIPQLMVPVAQGLHQAGYSRYAMSRAKATQFGNYRRGQSITHINQHRRFAAIRELSYSNNLARAQANRMRSW